MYSVRSSLLFRRPLVGRILVLPIVLLLAIGGVIAEDSVLGVDLVDDLSIN
jgi:hypothetical protein